MVTRVPRQSVVPEGSGGSAKPRGVNLPDDACIDAIVDIDIICRVRHVDRSGTSVASSCNVHAICSSRHLNLEREFF